jgi:hypothetical protein
MKDASYGRKENNLFPLLHPSLANNNFFLFIEFRTAPYDTMFI